MGNVDYRVRAGALEVEVHCDTSELDSALAKIQLLVERTERLQRLGVEVPGLLVATSLVASPRKFSRRSLFQLLGVGHNA